MGIDCVEFERQKELLRSPVGIFRSGYARYAAAMFFYTQNMLSAELLEIYRRCCKCDREDPLALARHEGVALETKCLFE